ncbi:winged helix-turn-helix domain-containing protein [Marinomonas ushuaiensis]|uniref:winged helix-turn-helix domain-containing protein n=1 Tax=Marinomonas ushuaiensis TaxID=263818 RepID=UPI0009FC603A
MAYGSDSFRRKNAGKTTDQILAVLTEFPDLALVDVASRISRSVSTVERAVSKLKKEGRIEYQGPKKNGVWLVIQI